jgi:V/A-type H+-transporting ATPase subunit A
VSGARLTRVVGSLAEASPLPYASLHELVHLGDRRLMGEVIRIAGDTATIQVFEETTGLALGEPVDATGRPLTAQLGPGLLGSVLDGVGRPLAELAQRQGSFLAPGGEAPTLSRERRWRFAPERAAGEAVQAGDVLGSVEECPGVPHRVMLPPGSGGRIDAIAAGEFRVDEPFGRLADGSPLTLAQSWPVRQPRPAERRLPIDRPFVTGQRVFDLLFPLAEGGSVALPGGFGTGKTVIEQSLARFAEADIVVFVGCGERGNEMADLLTEFPELVDPETGRSLMDRSVLIANTSNMPVAARESSIYLGMTIAEYYRDMGLRVALLADSLSRWAEALREMGSRLQEMPGEEGYPTHLANRLAKLYERAGRVRCAGAPERTGTVTFVSAVSPPGGDFSEPVTQASLRVVGALWALDPRLANQRQYPAVDWESSYSLYGDATAAWFSERTGSAWQELRREVLAILERERELREIAELAGPEALEDPDRLAMEIARMVREIVIGQSAYHPNDACSPPARTAAIASLVVSLHEAGKRALASGTPLGELDLADARRAIDAARQGEPRALEQRVSEARERIAALAEASAPGEAPA